VGTSVRGMSDGDPWEKTSVTLMDEWRPSCASDLGRGSAESLPSPLSGDVADVVPFLLDLFLPAR